MPQESPHSGAAQMCRTSVLPQAKPWRGAIHLPRACQRPGSPRDGTSRGACGITFEKFQDIKQGDVIEAFLMEQIEV